MTEQKKLTCTILAMVMNEYESMKVTLPKVDMNLVDRYLIVDANSTDGSAEYAREMGWDVIVESRPGVRYAYNEAFASINTDLVLIWSPDGNTPVEDIPRLLEKIHEGFDVVIGSRYLGDATSEDDMFFSKWANYIFTKTINLLFGGDLKDAMTNFRVFRTSLYHDLALDDGTYFAPFEKMVLLKDGGLGVEPLFSARTLLNKCKVTEIPSNEPARIHGAAKFPKVKGGIAYFLQLLAERIHPYRI